MTELVTYVVIGLAAGSIYGLAATGLVLTHTTSGVFNLAHGAVGALGAFAFFDLTDAGLPWPMAFVACTAIGGSAVGLVLEPLMRPLRAAPTHLQVVSTVGAMLALQGFIQWHWGSDPRFVRPFLPTATVSVLGARVGADQLLLVALGAIIAAGIAIGLRTTLLGATVRAVVDDPALLAETGRDPRRIRRGSWCAGSGLAVASGILLAPTVGLDGVLLTFVVVQAFGAAAIARFRHLGAAYAGGLVIGVAASITAGYGSSTGAWQALPSAVPFAALYLALVSRRDPTGVTAPRGPVPAAGRRAAGTAIGAATLLAVLAATSPARVPLYATAAALAVVLMGLALLVNLAGQVSLGHAALAAVGAATMAHLATPDPGRWVVALVAAGGLSALVGLVAALPSLRLSGLSLALATFAFGLMMARLAYLSGPMFGWSGERSVPRPDLVGLSDDSGFFVLTVAVAASTAGALAALDRGRLGRLLRAMGDSPDTLASIGVSPLAVRAAAFAVGGFLAGTGGALLAAVNETASAVAFDPNQSLFWVAVLAIGGKGVIVPGIRAALAGALIPYYLEPTVGHQLTMWFGLAAMVAAAARARNSPIAFPARLADAAAWRLERSPVAARIGR